MDEHTKFAAACTDIFDVLRGRTSNPAEGASLLAVVLGALCNANDVNVESMVELVRKAAAGPVPEAQA